MNWIPLVSQGEIQDAYNSDDVCWYALPNNCNMKMEEILPENSQDSMFRTIIQCELVEWLSKKNAIPFNTSRITLIMIGTACGMSTDAASLLKCFSWGADCRFTMKRDGNATGTLCVYNQIRFTWTRICGDERSPLDVKQDETW